MKEAITSFVGLDVHKDSIAIAVAEAHAYQGSRSWTAAHERHLSTIPLAYPAQEIAFVEYRHAIKDSHEQLARVTEALRVQSTQWRMSPLVQALMCLRGFDFVAAVTFVAEIGDLHRFAHPRALMAFLGLVPSEYSSGPTRHQGSITKTGNKHARRILIEAAWNYRHSARVSRALEVRQQGQPKIPRVALLVRCGAHLKLTLQRSWSSRDLPVPPLDTTGHTRSDR